MPERTTVERAKRDLRAGKRPTTAAGEFVREEMEHIRRGRHGARNTRQAIAIGLSKARRAGVPLQPPAASAAKGRTRKSAERAYEPGQGRRKPRAPSRARAKAVSRALKRESRAAASPRALSAHAKGTASRRRTRRSRAH
ncbi:MAG: transcription elongation factor [Steroidobacteraceae bacterium]